MKYKAYTFVIYGNRLTITFNCATVKQFRGKDREKLIDKAKRYIDELHDNET
jgi:hypothetical protein